MERIVSQLSLNSWRWKSDILITPWSPTSVQMLSYWPKGLDLFLSNAGSSHYMLKHWKEDSASKFKVIRERGHNCGQKSLPCWSLRTSYNKGTSEHLFEASADGRAVDQAFHRAWEMATFHCMKERFYWAFLLLSLDFCQAFQVLGFVLIFEVSGSVVWCWW